MKKFQGYLGQYPDVHKDVFVSNSADIIGNVTIDKDASIWFQAVLRGDIGKIVIGEGTNIQDHVVVHLTSEYGSTLGKHVTVGHSAIIHGCQIDDNVLIGMGAIILDGAHIRKNSIIGANTLVTKGKSFEEGVLILGSPAKAMRKLTEEEILSIEKSAMSYIQVSKEYLAENEISKN